MIKEIKKPKIKFKFDVFKYGKFYYDEENNEYFYEHKNSIIYFNLNGFIHRINAPAIVTKYDNTYCENGKTHRIDGPAEKYSYKPKFWINGTEFFPVTFAFKTKHLICEYCNDFCKQECFV